MSTYGIAALVVLVAIAAVLVVVAAVRMGRVRRPAPGATPDRRGAKWYEVLLAVVLLLALVVLAILIAVQLTSEGTAPAGWRAGTRSDLFLVVMLAVATLSLLFLLVYLVARLPGRSTAVAGEDGATVREESVRDPAASRLAGLLLLAIGILLIGWTYLTAPERADLMVQVLYPASIAVAIVLLFDKATRSWTPKSRLDGFREWLLCDLLLITLILGYVNVRQLEDPGAYGGFFWDMVHVAAFFFVFWCLDRTSFRGRFLVGFGYVTLLPLLLVLWRWVQEIEAPPELGWWSTVWPVFFLALAFFVLEVIALIGLKDARGHVVPAIKDSLFVVLYAAFLIAAAPSVD